MTKDKPLKLYVAMPCYGNMMSTGTALSLISLLIAASARGISVAVDTLGNDSMVTHARNILTHRFLKSDSTHLLFLDADVVLRNPADIIRMLDAGKDIIGAVYPRKKLNWDAVRRAVALNPNISDAVLEEAASDIICRFDPTVKAFAPSEPTKVLDLGAGCLLIRRGVFDRLKKCSPHIKESWDPSEQGPVTKYWRTGTKDDGVEVGEDLFFLYAARLLGIDAYTLPDVVVDHVGTYQFKGTLVALGALEAKINAAQQGAGSGNR